MFRCNRSINVFTQVYTVGGKPHRLLGLMDNVTFGPFGLTTTIVLLV